MWFFIALSDVEKSGTVGKEAFETILRLHGVSLTDKMLEKLWKSHGKEQEKIDYIQALSDIQLDMSAALVDETKWQVVVPPKIKRLAPHLRREDLAKIPETENCTNETETTVQVKPAGDVQPAQRFGTLDTSEKDK